jgi:hypothetical protein
MSAEGRGNGMPNQPSDDSPMDPGAASRHPTLLERLLDPGDAAAVPPGPSPSVVMGRRPDVAAGALPVHDRSAEAWDDELEGGSSATSHGTDARSTARRWLRHIRRVPWRPVRDGLALLGLGYAAFLFLVIAPQDHGVGSDTYAYWSVSPADPYHIPEGQLGAFPYAPPIAQLFEPFARLPWDFFLVLWLGVLLATIIWLGWGKTLLVLAFPPVAIELYHGNVNLLIAAAIALGFRYPATWSFVLLTKVTPGIGVLWFVVRREWHQLAIAVGVTSVIVIASFVLDQSLWTAWASALVRDSSASLGGPLGIPILIRLPVAAALVIWGARTDRSWTVPAAATLAMPTLFIAVFAVLAAIPAIKRPELMPRVSGRSWS